MEQPLSLAAAIAMEGQLHGQYKISLEPVVGFGQSQFYKPLHNMGSDTSPASHPAKALKALQRLAAGCELIKQ